MTKTQHFGSRVQQRGILKSTIEMAQRYGFPKGDKMILGKKWGDKIPLSYYRNKSFNVVRNDALDRFGTPLEQRFSKVQITSMMEKAGLSDIHFSKNQPYWHVIGRK